MKKLILLSIVLICISFGVKSQNMTVNGLDVGSPAPTTGDYWLITWVVQQYYPDHGQGVLNTWQGSDLTLAQKTVPYVSSNSWSIPCYFQVVGGVPNILSYDFQVTVGVKRWVYNNGDFGAGSQVRTAFMNTNGFTGSFSVNCYIQ